MSNQNVLEMTGQKADETPRSERNLSLEILRIISMFLIIARHFLGYGEFLENATGASWYIEKLINTIFLISVNVFVIISGYFLSVKKHPFKFKKFIRLVLQTCFYSLSIWIIFVVFGLTDFSLRDLFLNTFPFLNARYWFVTCYLIMYLMSPFLNMIIKNSTRKQLTLLMLGIVFLCAVQGLLGISGHTSFEKGFSSIWFLCLYLMSGYIRKFNFDFIKNWQLVLLYLLGFVGSICMWIVPGLQSILFFKNFFNAANTSNYSAILVVISSLSAFMLFERIKIKNSKFMNKVILTISSTLFGVYLIHNHFLMRQYLYKNIFHVEKFYSQNIAFVWLILFVLIVFVSCMLIDLLRQACVGFGRKYVFKSIKFKR